MKKAIMVGILVLLALLPFASARVWMSGSGGTGGAGDTEVEISKPRTQATEETINSEGYNRLSSLPLRTTLYYPFGKTQNFLVNGEKCSLTYNGFGNYVKSCDSEFTYEVKTENWYRSYLTIR